MLSEVTMAPQTSALWNATILNLMFGRYLPLV